MSIPSPGPHEPMWQMMVRGLYGTWEHFGRKVGVSRQRVHGWRKRGIPEDACYMIEAKVVHRNGEPVITRKMMRPDIFGYEPDDENNPECDRFYAHCGIYDPQQWADMLREAGVDPATRPELQGREDEYV